MVLSYFSLYFLLERPYNGLMKDKRNSKLQKLHQTLAHHGVATSGFLESLGIYQQLVNSYVKSGWLKGLGGGAYFWAHYPPHLEEAIKSLQQQLKHPVHIGGKTIVRQMRPHYLPLGDSPMFLFSPALSKTLPRWFQTYPWPQKIYFLRTKLFKKNFFLGIKENEEGLKVSKLERALFEMLYELPQKHSWEEVDKIFENLYGLNPSLVQKCLENCQSMKTRRLFLLFSQRHNHSWFERMKTDEVSLGQGVYPLYKKGVVHPYLKISVPSFLMQESPRQERHRLRRSGFVLRSPRALSQSHFSEEHSNERVSETKPTTRNTKTKK